MYHEPHTLEAHSPVPTGPVESGPESDAVAYGLPDATVAGSRRRGLRRRLALIGVHLGTVAVVLSVPTAAFADSTGPMYLAAKTLPQVIAGLQTWIMGILAAVATLFLVLAGVYYATAGGDPAQVDKAKGAFKNALIGYGLAVLAPVLLEVVKGIVGG